MKRLQTQKDVTTDRLTEINVKYFPTMDFHQRYPRITAKYK